VKGDDMVINQVTLVGRLVKDPELKWTPDGKAVANVTLAVNRHYKNANGEIEADFVHCTLWHKTAENTSQYCKKGSVIGVTGRIQTRHYDNQEGRRVYVTEVVAEGVRFLSPKQGSTREGDQSIPPVFEREELPFA
jgi:single-strand DNA-binding protein